MPATTITGACSVICAVCNALGNCEETIPLQQSWLWFDGSHGIEPQHCILCWSGFMADIQSANCSSRTAVTAEMKSVVFRTILLDSRMIRLRESTIGYVSEPIVTSFWLPPRGAIDRVVAGHKERLSVQNSAPHGIGHSLENPHHPICQVHDLSVQPQPVSSQQLPSRILPRKIQ